jgi:hypothetical protein
MIIDFSNIKLNSTLDLSLILFIFGLFSYYFGKLIEECKPTKDVKQVTYMSGAFFIFFYILLPGLIIYQFSKQLILVKNGFLWMLGCFILQNTLFSITHKKSQAYQMIKSGYTELFNKKVKSNTNKLLEKLNINKYNKIDQDKIINIFFINKLSDFWLFIIVLAQILIFINVIFVSSNVLFIFIIFTYLFLGTTNVAVLYGWNRANYPIAKGVLTDKEIIEGRLMKIEDDYVNIRGEKKTYHINKNNIKYILIEEKIDLTKIEKKIDKVASLIENNKKGAKK